MPAIQFRHLQTCLSSEIVSRWSRWRAEWCTLTFLVRTMWCMLRDIVHQVDTGHLRSVMLWQGGCRYKAPTQWLVDSSSPSLGSASSIGLLHVLAVFHMWSTPIGGSSPWSPSWHRWRGANVLSLPWRTVWRLQLQRRDPSNERWVQRPGSRTPYSSWTTGSQGSTRYFLWRVAFCFLSVHRIHTFPCSWSIREW